MVKSQRCRDEYIGYTLQGNILDILKKRKKISIEQILEAEEGKKKPRLVLVEGAPGIGKSTLAWELCRKWEEFSCLQQYSLVILLRLREREVQTITNIGQLFGSYESKDRETLTEEVSESQGRGVLFVLDGFDELPKPLQENGYLLNLIKGNILPESTVVVTSRPSATGKLLTSCRPQVQMGKHVEVLGFTQESVEKYAYSIFSAEPKKLEKFLAYISASNNPAINSLMYVPLNAAIIVEIFRDCKSDSFLPHTLTELYTQLCLTILNRFLQTHNPSVNAYKFEDLIPSGLYKNFILLSKLALDGIKNDKVIFHTAPPNLIHFGFLDAVTALYGGGGVSYNFLHLTIQEFFAAYHISHLGISGLEVFQEYGKVERWNVVWRFVAGLTKFKKYAGKIDTSVFSALYNKVSYSLFLFQCMFEAQTMDTFSSAFKLDHTKEPSTTFNSALSTSTAANKKPVEVFVSSTAYDSAQSGVALVEAYQSTALDAYAIGYCIANFPIGVRWSVKLEGDTHHSFTSGLMTNTPSVGDLAGLHLFRCQLDVADLKSNPLRYATHLGLTFCELADTDMTALSEVIPHLTCLKALSIDGNLATDGQQDGLLKVLQQLYHSKVIELHMSNTGLEELLDSPHDYSLALNHLLNKDSGKLEVLAIGSTDNKSDGKNVADLLSGDPLSVHSLGLFFHSLSSHVVHLKENTWLVGLGLFFNKFPPHISDMVDIVNSNKTLQYLAFLVYSICDESVIDSLRPLVSAIYTNDTLQKILFFTLGIGENDEAVSDYMTTHHKELTTDPRLLWKFNDHC